MLQLTKVCRCCSKAIEKIQQESDETWRFYRITVIFEYKDKPSFPPPLIIISHLINVYDKTKRNVASGGIYDDGKFVFVFYIVLSNTYLGLYSFMSELSNQVCTV